MQLVGLRSSTTFSEGSLATDEKKLHVGFGSAPSLLGTDVHELARVSKGAHADSLLHYRLKNGSNLHVHHRGLFQIHLIKPEAEPSRSLCQYRCPRDAKQEKQLSHEEHITSLLYVQSPYLNHTQENGRHCLLLWRKKL